jgi:hypothetical protein
LHSVFLAPVLPTVLSPEVRNSALAPQSVRVSLLVAWLPQAWPAPGSLREQQVEH